MSSLAEALVGHVEAGEVAGLVALVGRGADIEITVSRSRRRVTPAP
jgi:hypothetical protein